MLSEIDRELENVGNSHKFRDQSQIWKMNINNVVDASYKQKALYLMLFYLILIVVKTWSILIVKKCQSYFRDQAQFRPVVMKYTRHVPDEENQSIS